MLDFVDDPQGVPHPESAVEEVRGAVAAPIRTAPGCQDGDCIQVADEIQGGVGVAVESASVEVEIDAGAEQIPENGGQRKLPVTGNDDISPREGPGVFRAKGRIIAAQKNRHTGPRRPDFPDGFDDTGVPVGHHGADQDEVGPADGLQESPGTRPVTGHSDGSACGSARAPPASGSPRWGTFHNPSPDASGSRV